jgi:3-deoxy-D-manno-octulosonic-acid transferase
MLDAFYLVVALIALPWVAWRRLSGGRPVAAVWTRFTGGVPALPRVPGRQRLWLHGVSVGEVALLSSLAAELRKQAEREGRSIEFVVSSSTTTGLAVARARFPETPVVPCPLDFSWAVERTLAALQPDLLVLGELELWPQLLARTARRGIPIAVVNGRMSEQSCRGYRRVAPLVRRMLGRVTVVIARSPQDADRFRSLGAEEVLMAGSMKYDSVRGDRQAADVQRLARLAGITPDDIVFLAGSTQSPEELLAIESFRAMAAEYPGLRLVLVPRHVERANEIAGLLQASGIRWQRRSRLEADGADATARVLLVDVTGELSAWWGTAAIAFVGGSLDGRRGGQNMLEPSAYAATVAFGPHTRNFQDEVATLKAENAVRIVHDGSELTDFLSWCLADRSAARAMGARAAAVVAGKRGATALTATRLLRLAGPLGATATARQSPAG